MTSIVYGIVDAARLESETLPAGLNEMRMVAIRHGKLAALLSPISENGSAHVDRVLAFARIVEGLHRRMTILPMRFGSLVRRPEEAADFLRLHERELISGLKAVDGCDEMGLRMLVRDIDPPGARGTAETPGMTAVPEGIAYLERRRKYYERQRQMDEACEDWARRIQVAFAGLFLEVRREHAPSQEGRLLSLSFLVKHSKVDAFLQRCRDFRKETSAEAICSGPWPTYGFVPDLAKSPKEMQL